MDNCDINEKKSTIEIKLKTKSTSVGSIPKTTWTEAKYDAIYVAAENGDNKTLQLIESTDGKLIDDIGVIELMSDAARGGHIETMHLLKGWIDTIRNLYGYVAQRAAEVGQIEAAKLAKSWADESPGMSPCGFLTYKIDNKEAKLLVESWEKDCYNFEPKTPPNGPRGGGRRAAVNEYTAAHLAAWQVG